tara:strand:- start:1073 stop:1936 length:864 start_codon:yes stop_codon:yes gene_type:complete
MTATKSLKTPLRYPGGKSRAITKMSQFFPDLTGYNQFREPFLGGGSVALWVTKQYPDLLIWVNDLYEPLYNFWTQLQCNGVELENKLLTLKADNNDPDKARELFRTAKEEVNDEGLSSEHRAVCFYVINKCSFSGLTEASSFSSQASESNFSERGIRKLTGYQSLIKYWKITNNPYETLLTNPRTRQRSKDAFIYLDPPYEIDSHLYGKKGDMHRYFNHDNFSKKCDGCSQDLLVSYNSSQLIRNRFSTWNASEYDHTYTMRSTTTYTKAQKNRKELVLTNYGKALG